MLSVGVFITSFICRGTALKDYPGLHRKFNHEQIREDVGTRLFNLPFSFCDFSIFDLLPNNNNNVNYQFDEM